MSNKKEDYYAESDLFMSPNPKDIPVPMPFLSQLKYCSNLNKKQKLYINNISENWRYEINRLKKGNKKYNPWIENLKSLEFYPEVMNEVCYLVKKGINPAEPENYEWTIDNLIDDERGGMPFYSEMDIFIKNRFINSIKYLNKNLTKSTLPFYRSNKNKVGGGNYKYIINPLTGRKVNINGIIGKKVLNNYIKQLNK